MGKDDILQFRGKACVRRGQVLQKYIADPPHVLEADKI